MVDLDKMPHDCIDTTDVFHFIPAFQVTNNHIGGNICQQFVDHLAPACLLQGVTLSFCQRLCFHLLNSGIPRRVFSRRAICHIACLSRRPPQPTKCVGHASSIERMCNACALISSSVLCLTPMTLILFSCHRQLLNEGQQPYHYKHGKPHKSDSQTAFLIAAEVFVIS